jgi:predicted ATPase
MIKKITINNYKSIDKLSFEIGRVNILIGENGSGKSNILEAIAFGAAASKNKLDNEFLANRGIRVTDPQFMRSAFNKKNLKKEISLVFECTDEKKASFNLVNDNEPYSKWKEIIHISRISEDKKKVSSTIETRLFEKLLQDVLKEKEKSGNKKAVEQLLAKIQENYSGSEACKNFENYLIFSPENSCMRNFQKEGQIEPLGRKGEGLFKLIKSFYIEPDKGKFHELNDLLNLFNWFKSFDIPPDLFGDENTISVFDKFIYQNSKTIDQRSTSEGFLFLLFYFSLLISDNTPNFFAIENLETALNPKLCTKVTQLIVELAKKYNKQVILTTHNPAILDGLNLDDPEQKLFIVYRNAEGNTTLNNYKKPNPVEGEQLAKVSESFLRGYIGGLPNNFSL